MVNADGGQLFTIEGIAAALIMLATVFVVVNTTSVYTPGDTHVNDMQLEVIGTDALKMLNTMDSMRGDGKSPLVRMIELNDADAFNKSFNYILNNRTGADPDTIQFSADISYKSNCGATKSVNTTHFTHSERGILYGGEHAVHVSQWIILDDYNTTTFKNVFPEQCGSTSAKRAALVEVYLWRD